MVIQPHFNHYDDDGWDEEPWDEEPVAASAPVSPAQAWSSSGSSFATMQLDAALLPVRVELSKQWSRYVEPRDVGDELMRAYQGAVNERVAQRFSSGAWPSLASVSEGAVPPYRTMLMLLLETETWEQYRETCSAVVRSGDYRAHGRAEIYDEPAVLVRADRISLLSITVWQEWAQQADRLQIADEILWCADEIRSLRPKLVVRGDFSRYSEEDLEFRLERHRQRLFEDRVI
ncbi:hypothetical protein ACL02S_16700 [Nocardia sp. 004]|uniref:hypothetical protein n=1 Tax=Nocardia sp. 004 TaxID=3385978 RepID=UPI0039A15F84